MAPSEVAVDFYKVMYGSNALHLPINLIVQDVGGGRVAGVFQCATDGLRFGSTMVHQLFQGDAVFRPVVVRETDDLRGLGIATLYTQGFIAPEWDRAGAIINILGGREGGYAAKR